MFIVIDLSALDFHFPGEYAADIIKLFLIQEVIIYIHTYTYTYIYIYTYV